MVARRFCGGSEAKLLVSSLAVALLLLSGAASAAPTWLASVDLSPVGNGGNPDVALDAAGDAVAIWEQSDGVEAATRRAGGEWSAARIVSAGCSGSVSAARLATNAAGTAAAIWQCDVGGPSTIQAAIRPAGHSWSPALNLSAPGAAAGAPQVALDAGGDAAAVWKRNDGTTDRIQASYRRADGAWTPPGYISTGFGNYPQVAIDSSGDAVAVWQTDDGRVEASQSSSTGAWGAPKTLSNGGTSWYPRVALDSAGDAIAVWSRQTPGLVAEAAIRPAGGSWGRPENLSSPSDDAFGPQVAVGRGGAAVVIWADAGAAFSIQASTRPARGAWSAPQKVSADSSHVGTYSLSMNPAGSALVGWSRQVGDVDAVEAARRPVAGRWGAPAALSPAHVNADSVAVALDAAGDGAAVWQRTDLDGSVVQAAGLDAAGPRVTRLKITGRRAARTRLTFSVSAIDSWSNVDDARWTFGDGTRAFGLHVKHGYRRPGSYTVRLLLVDASGNKSSISRRLTIGRARNTRR